MIRPSNNIVTLTFGATTPPYSAASPHIGVDFGHDPDMTIYMPEDGQVNVVAWDGKTAEGNVIYVTAANHYHALCHMSKFLVTSGFVKKGTPVGIMGETGFAQGVHLHWALKVDGKLVNALDYVTEGEDMSDIADHDFVADACVLGMNLQPETNQVFLNNIGLPKSQVLKNILGYTESSSLRIRAQSADDNAKRVKELEAQLAAAQATVKPYNGPQLFVKTEDSK